MAEQRDATGVGREEIALGDLQKKRVGTSEVKLRSKRANQKSRTQSESTKSLSPPEIHLLYQRDANANTISTSDETDGRRSRTLKFTYNDEIHIFPLEPGKKVGELVDEIERGTNVEPCRIQTLNGVETYANEVDVFTIKIPFRLYLDGEITEITKENELDVPLRATWIRDKEKNRNEIVSYLEKTLNEGHVVTKKKYVSDILQVKLKECQGDVNRTLVVVLVDSYTPQQTLKMVMKLLYMGAKASGVTTGDSQTDKMVIPLHLAIKKEGCEDVVLTLLSWGAPIDQRDMNGNTVLDIAFRDKRDELTAWIIRHMHPRMVREIFSYTFHNKGSSTVEPISLRAMIKGSSGKNDMEGKKKRPMKKSVLAVLDSLWEETKEGAIAYYFPLECDEEGRGPDDKGFDLKGGKSCLQHLAVAGDPEYIEHKVVKLLVNRKWKLYARTYYTVSAVLYLIASVCLTTALALALDTKDLLAYNNGRQDEVRLTCECVVLFWMAITFILEIFEFKNGKCRYIKNPLNYLDLGSVLFLVATIIARIAGSPTQWWFLSAGYICAVLRMVKFFALYRHLRAYLITFRRTLGDFLSFFILFALFNFAFTGAFSAALRYDGELSSTNNTRTSNFGHIFFAFAQILVDNEPAIPFYQEGFVYGVYPTILLLVSLFVSLVMLMNLLIAQLSDTYQKTRTDAKLEVYRNRAEMVEKVERFGPQIQRVFYKDEKKLSHAKIRKLELTKSHQKTPEDMLDEMQHKIYELENNLVERTSALARDIEKILACVSKEDKP